MKNFMYLAAALLAMVGCKNNEDVTTPQTAKGVSFKQGDIVTITTGSAQAPKHKANGNVTSKGVEFTWSDGDELTIRVGSATAQFTLESGAGTKNGVFTGTMPAGGETFTAEYKGEYAEDIRSETQTYTENGIDMKFVHAVAENCVVTEDGWSSISLNVDNAAVLIFNLQCDLKIGFLSINQKPDDAPKRRKTSYPYAQMSFGDNGLQLSFTTPTKVAILLDKGNLSSDFKPSIDEFGDDGKHLPLPVFKLDGVAAGDAVDYPLKKWVNLTLPDVATKKQSAQLCALGEKTELNFNFSNSDISDKKLCLKVGDHTIFNKNVSELWPASGIFADHTFNDANDNNQEYKLHMANYGVTTEFTITSAVTEYSLNHTFAVTLKGKDCYYIWSADAEWDEDEGLITGGSAYTLLHSVFVDGFTEQSLLNAGMTSCKVGDVINENTLTRMDGFSFVIADNPPTIQDLLGVQGTYTFKKAITDANGKSHNLYMFPSEGNGPAAESYKSLTIN